jgi:hypothetical protein
MATCPACSKPIQGDFGLVNCQHCGVPVMIDFDGDVSISGASQESGAWSEAEGLPPVPESEAYDMAPPPSSDQEVVSVTQTEPQIENELAPPAELNLQVQELPPVPYSLESLSANEEPPVIETEIPEESHTAPAASADLRDIAEFANSELSQASDTTIRYHLEVLGIDTASLKQALVEAIDDKKLGLNADQLMQSLRGGRLKISNISPVKCAIIVQRLKSLPIDLRWEQYVVHKL